MPGKSKRKGNTFESRVVECLSAWWGEKFVRTPNSGALRWNNGIWTFGDLCPPNSFPCCVECKHHWEVDIDELLRKHVSDARISWFWYFQTRPDSWRASGELNKTIHPLLVYRENVGKGQKVFMRLCMELYMWEALPQEIKKAVPMIMVQPLDVHPVVIVDLSKFVEVCPREVFETTFSSSLPPLI